MYKYTIANLSSTAFRIIVHIDNVVPVIVVTQFLSSIFALAKMARLPQFFCNCSHSISWHPPSSNQSSLSPLPLASSMALAFSCHLFLRSRATLKTLSSSLSQHISIPSNSIHCCYRPIVSFNPSMFICSSVVFLSTITASVFHKIAFLFSFKHHALLSNSIADLMQQ